jgi:hypothetical protein
MSFSNGSSLLVCAKQLREHRNKERDWAIKNGFMADPDVPRALADAITLVGTCQDMCPEFERATRIGRKDVWTMENVCGIRERMGIVTV